VPRAFLFSARASPHRYADDSFAHNPVGFYYEDGYSGYMNWWAKTAHDAR
jgi:hypothetical protein